MCSVRSLVITRRNIYSDVSSEIIRTDNTSQLFQMCCLMSSVLTPRHNSFRRAVWCHRYWLHVTTLSDVSNQRLMFRRFNFVLLSPHPPPPHYNPSSFTNITNNTEEIHVTHLNAGVRLKSPCIPPFNAMFTWKAYVAVTMGGMAGQLETCWHRNCAWLIYVMFIYMETCMAEQREVHWHGNVYGWTKNNQKLIFSLFFFFKKLKLIFF